MKAKKPKVSTVKKRLDNIFNEYIRRRDIRGSGECAICCSCGKIDEWKNMDAGHFVPCQHNATRYDERNVNIQCRKCNRYDEGNSAGYAVFLIKKYGADIIEELDALGHTTKQFKVSELLELEQEYKQKLIELKET